MEFKRTKDFLVCVDSDGCAMDTMNIKHFEAFGPEFVKIMDVEEQREDVLKRWNKTNLFSKKRGINRFLSFLDGLEYVHENIRPVEGIEVFREYVHNDGKLSTDGIEKAYTQSKADILKKVIDWSYNVNDVIKKIPRKKNESFKNVLPALQEIAKKANIVVVSTATKDAVQTEWTKAGLMGYVDAVFTQEFGSKTESIAHAKAVGNYEDDKMIKIGDAPGDLEAARNNHAYFYPIIAMKEEESWIDFRNEYFEKFINGQYNEVQDQLIDKFLSELDSL
ncbi:MAG TPA: HAD family hydrolase [Corynebacteriales bacterium]|jgi:phosphoglycolate phosphatase-like HAD superfamily hydrolase|nr:HAD family hydrolase [Eubacteriaceae bacterium]HHY08197.1 HAD family hydrolase [Mycobacteriales bacterium]